MSVGHNRVPYKTDEPIKDAVWVVDSGGNQVLCGARIYSGKQVFWGGDRGFRPIEKHDCNSEICNSGKIPTFVKLADKQLLPLIKNRCSSLQDKHLYLREISNLKQWISRVTQTNRRRMSRVIASAGI